MGKEQANLETAFHPERYPDDEGRVDVVVHWGAHDIDAKVTVTVERWRRVAQLARVDLDAAAGELLSIAGVEAPVEKRATVIGGYARSLKAILGL
jgi:hypothetical protein